MLRLAGFASLFALVAGCGSSTETIAVAPSTADGTLALSWTINGTNDPNQCVQGAADSMRLEVFDAAGGFVGEFAAACEAFATRVSLAPGSYTGRAHLADVQGVPRTTDVDIVPWNIVGATVLDVPIDFPASSFLGIGPASERP